MELITNYDDVPTKVGETSPRGQNSKIFQNGFSTIKSLILKVEQRI